MGCKVPASREFLEAACEQILAAERTDSSQMSTEIFFLLIDNGFCRAEIFLAKNNQEWGLAFGGAGYPDFRGNFAPNTPSENTAYCV